jgi:peptidyl-tRNA hydrolase, PTH1 family
VVTKAVFGLGNPGAEYVYTRHNIGFQVLILLADKLKHEFTPFETGEWTKIKWDYSTHYLIKPMTFMNRSGDSVLEVNQLIGLKPEEILVVVDDMQIPYGEVRIRAKGSSGGHNGLKSIIEALGTEDFPRMRIGIGFKEGVDPADYVLDVWTEDEKEILDRILPLYGDMVMFCLINPIEKACQLFHGDNPAGSVKGLALTEGRLN